MAVIPKTAASFETALDAQALAGATSLTLVSAADVDGNNLASGLYAFTLDGDVAEYKEFVLGTLSGTTLSSVYSISAQGVATSGTSKYHRRGALVSLTDWVAIGRLGATSRGDTGFDSAAPLYYDADPTFSSDQQIVTKKYVDDLVNGGTVSYNQLILPNQTAGENLTIRDYVYFKESDQRWYKVDADDTATFSQLKRGFAAATQTTRNTLSIYVDGVVSGFVGLTAGSKYYASNTAGAITTTPGTYTVFAGVALSTTTLLADQYIRDIPTGAEKDALAGSNGVPGSSNTYLTQTNTTNGSYDQSQLTQNATAAVGTASTTGLNNRLAQSFIPTKTKISGVALYKSADTGSFTGTVSIALQADSSGSPSGSDLASVTITNAEWLAIPTGEFRANFGTEYQTMTVGSLYWIVITTSTADSSNRPNLGTNSAGGYASGSVKGYNATDGWFAISTIDLYFKTNQGNISQAVFTGTDGFIATRLTPVSRLLTTSIATTALTASEATLATISLTAGQVTTTSVIKVMTLLNITQAGASAATTIRLRADSLSGTVMASNVVSNTSDSGQQGPARVMFEVMQNASLAAQTAISSATVTIGTGNKAALTITTGTIDLAQNRTLYLTGQLSTVSSYAVDYRGMYAELVK